MRIIIIIHFRIIDFQFTVCVGQKNLRLLRPLPAALAPEGRTKRTRCSSFLAALWAIAQYLISQQQKRMEALLAFTLLESMPFRVIRNSPIFRRTTHYQYKKHFFPVPCSLLSVPYSLVFCVLLKEQINSSTPVRNVANL
jgi:hypothetical protein